MSARAIGIVGIVGFALIVAASFIAPPLWEAPGTSSSGAAVVEYLRADSGRIIASLFVYSLAMGLFLVFAGGLFAWLREREPGRGSIAAIFAAGAVGLAVLILAGFVPIAVGAYRSLSPELTGTLADLTFGLLALSGIPTAVCLGAYAVLVGRSGVLPMWTAWLAALGALAHVLIAASFTSHGSFLSLEGSVIVWVPATFFVWILATSFVLLRLKPSGAGA